MPLQFDQSILLEILRRHSVCLDVEVVNGSKEGVSPAQAETAMPTIANIVNIGILS